MTGVQTCALPIFNIGGCNKVTDAGISALVAGCGQLQSINLGDCDQVRDAGISALGAGCGPLRSISIEDCSKVTDAGISVVGCRMWSAAEHQSWRL